MKRAMSMCLLGVALIACGQKVEPIGEVAPLAAAEQRSGPCQTSALEYAKPYGTITKLLADVSLPRASFIQQDNARGPGREEIPTGTRGTEKIHVCVWEGDFQPSSPQVSERARRLSVIVEPDGFIWMRQIGSVDGVLVPTAE